MFARFHKSYRQLAKRSYASSCTLSFPMKPGTPIPGLKIYKDKDAPVVLERSEYPAWVDTLTQPLPSLAQLRKLPLEEATDRDKRRFLKLTRRQKIRERNEAQ
ncbi:hypothetical protein FisN_30Lh049 [Fistulifera solaris]|uniref:Large ribosomal subunit protein mL54 n=1 Tax=Fistulifera solaris TaxID=1519565 RepID=A0A1Z5JJ20_FISSO|nr:hypothetical protein FisN_30Lh049 [Fistulifera solaris]|eukprot:GAX13761.1 hypothetical protein FisN_30Lh049 [Fistulifera solaris]